MKARFPVPDDAVTWEMVEEVIDMDLEITIHSWMGPACTVRDEHHPQKGCAQLRGEGAGETFEEALRDACNQAINHLHPADPEHLENSNRKPQKDMKWYDMGVPVDDDGRNETGEQQ